MTTEADKLAIKLESYVLQLREVEAALNVDPTHVELIKIKADLNELIHLTKKILTEKLNAGVTITGHNGGGSCGEPGPSRSSSSRSQSAAKTEAIMLSLIKTLGDENYRNFIFKAFDETRSPEIVRSIFKHLTKRGTKVLKRRWNGSRKDMDDDDSDAGEANRCNGSAGPAMSESSRSAWKTPLIHRGDLIPREGLLFMIVKKIRLKPTIYRDHKLVGAVVCIVGSKKELVFWSLIRWNDQEVCQTYPNLTAITRDKLELGLPLDSVIIIRIPSACSCGSNSTVSKIEDPESRNEITTSLKDEQKVEDGPSMQIFSTTSNVDEFTNSAHNSGVEVPSTSTIVPPTSTHILQTHGSNESANYTESAIPLPNVSMVNADNSASNLTGGGIKTVNLSVDAEANSIQSAATTPATNPYDKIVKENEIANDDLVKNWDVIRKANLSKNMINRLRVKRRRLRQNELKKTLSLFGMEDYWKNLKPPKRKRKKNFKR